MAQTVKVFDHVDLFEMWEQSQSMPEQFVGFPGVVAMPCNAGRFYRVAQVVYKCIASGNYFTPVDSDAFIKLTAS